MPTKLAIASDHGGFLLKEAICNSFCEPGVELTDLGVHTADAVDYPDISHQLARCIFSHEADLGVIICGTGIGVSIAANRHTGIRAALCTDPFMARMSRAHNDANVLCLGGRVIGIGLAMEILHVFLVSPFEGDRHLCRIQKIEIS